MENIWNLDFATWWHIRLVGTACTIAIIIAIYAWRARQKSIKEFEASRAANRARRNA